MALAVKHVSFAKSLCIDQADIDTQRIGFLTSSLTDNVSENQCGRCQMNGLVARKPTSEGHPSLVQDPEDVREIG